MKSQQRSWIGDSLNFYDIAGEGCTFDDKLAKRLGFKKIAVVNKDIIAAGAGSEGADDLPDRIAFGKDLGQLLSLIKNGAKAVVITDSYMDKQLMETISNNDCILCMPMNIITASSGMERTKNIYRMAKLLKLAMRKRIKVGFISLAKTPQYLNSYIQLIELAKLIGADEQYARNSISEINKMVVGK